MASRRVCVRYQGGDDLFLGQELRVENGRSTVRFDDGEESAEVLASWITYVQPVRERNASVGLRVFAKDDEAKFDVYAGVLSAVDGFSAGIRFDDGDTRSDVPLSAIYTAVEEEPVLPASPLGSPPTGALAASSPTSSPGASPAASAAPEDDDYDDDFDMAASPSAVFDLVDSPRATVAEKASASLVAAASKDALHANAPDDDDYDDTLHVTFLETAVANASDRADGERAQQAAWKQASKQKALAGQRQTNFSALRAFGAFDAQTIQGDGWGFTVDSIEDSAGLDPKHVPCLEPLHLYAVNELRSVKESRLDAEPFLRLAAMLFDANLLDVARFDGLAGTVFFHDSSGPFDWSSRTQDDDPSPTVFDALLQLRMRCVAACRLCCGSAADATLHALLDLAAAYGSKGLWVQSLQHATRVDGILASRPELRQRSSRDDDESAEVGSADEQTQKMAESVLFVLGKLASLSNSVRWIDLIAVLNAQEAHLLGAAPFGVREGGGAEEMTWAECVSFLRKSHAGFVRATAQLERKCGPHNLALLHLAFQAHDDSGGGVCSPPVLRWSLSKLPACACAFEGSALAKWLGRRCLEWQNESVPITWEETVAIAATAPPSSTKLRARARLVSGQAHAQLPTSRNEAKKYLQQALSLKGGNALSAQAHASLADAYVSEHAAFAKSTAKKCRKEAERWLDSDEGHRLWRAEVSRLMADVRAHVSVSLTKPEVEVRARDVLLDARAEYVERRASKEVDGFLPLEAARTHLEQALQATILAHGAHKQNAFAANAMASLGQLDVVCGRLDAAHANVLRACQLLNAQDGRGTAAAVQLSRIVRRMPNCTAGDLETGASFVKKAAVYHTTAAKSCNKKLKGGLASQAASSKVAADAAAHACQARELWESVALLLPDTQQAVDALQHALEAAKLADGDGIEAMKALRSLAKQRAAMGDHRGAERDYAVLEASALRAGAGDLARKAQKARLNERRHVQDQHF